MVEAQARPADVAGPRFNDDRLPEEERRAERDVGLGQDQALGPTGFADERLTGRGVPPVDPGRLDEGQVDRVVDMAHRVGVGEAERNG